MSELNGKVGGDVDTLRRAFDLGFSAAPLAGDGAREDFLSVRVGGQMLAVRLRELTGFLVGRKVVSLQGGAPDFLGIAGIRGGLVPVFSLSSLLGRGMEPPGRWLLLCGTAAEPVGLSVRDFDGHLPGSRDTLVRAADERAAGPHIRELLRINSSFRPVVSIESVLATIRERATPTVRSDEP